MIRRTGIALICAAFSMWPVTHASAQKMYRCGSAYQDRPCASSQPEGRVVGSVNSGTQTAAASTGVPAKDPMCTQRGADALKVVWARDGGMLQEQQVAETDRKGLSAFRREQELQLIESVYRKRGSAPDIRAAIEAECIAEKERAAQAAALAAAAVRLQGGVPAVTPQMPNDIGPPTQDTRTSQDQAAQQQQQQKQAHSERCAALAQQGEAIRRQERSGGSAATMDRLSQHSRDIQARQRSEGC